MTNAPQLRPLGETLGTEAVGIDLSQPLDERDFRLGRARPSQKTRCWCSATRISAPPELAAFGRRFGTPRKHALIKYRHAEHPDVSWLTNVDEDGKVDWYGVKRATDWHTNSTYEDDLPLLAILHAKEVPSDKGGTMFSDMAAAYAALPEATREQLAGLTAPARPPHRPGRREAVWRFQGCDRKAVSGSRMAGSGSPSGDRPAHPVRQPDAHARLHRPDPRRSLAADRGTRRACDAGSIRLLPPLAGRRRADVGRARDNAPRRRRFPSRRAPGHAAHDRVSELIVDAFPAVSPPLLCGILPRSTTTAPGRTDW